MLCSIVLLLICSVDLALSVPMQLVLLTDGVSTGALCLDGSPPGYYLRPGSGSGQNKLIFYMKGGGMCFDEDACLERSKGDLGSSTNWPREEDANLNGFLSNDPQLNPLFHDWTLVYLMYCDGASYSGNLDHVFVWKGTNLYFRGFRILTQAIESIKVTRNFTDVILTGSSAGGLSTYQHVDYVSSLFPGAKFHALADAGFFIDAPNIDGVYRIRNETLHVYKMQSCVNGLNQDCVKSLSPQGMEWQCMAPPYSEPFIKSKIFALNSQYDTWQLKNILQINCLPPNCSPEEEKAAENYGKEFMDAISDFMTRKSEDVRGYFLDSCIIHTQSLSNHYWYEVTINGQTANETFTNWYTGSGNGREVDCAYPCNKSC